MRLYVCFVYHIEPKEITQGIEKNVVGVMAGSYSVEIVLFDQYHISQHGALGNHAYPVLWRELVPIYSLKLHIQVQFR